MFETELEMLKVLIRGPRECPRCKVPNENIEGQDFECPSCGASFCNSCFEPILDGDGRKIKCPQCKCKLGFPTKRETL